MQSSSSSGASGGVGILGLLGVAFVVLKLTGVIGWSWWWVTAPFWGLPALVGFPVACWFLFWLTVRITRKARA